MVVFFGYILYTFLFFAVHLKSNNEIYFNRNNSKALFKLAENEKFETIKNYINLIKLNPDLLFYILNNKETYLNVIEDYLDENNMSFLYPLIEEMLNNETNTFINDLYNVIKNNNTDGTNALNYIINILNDLESSNNVNISDILFNIHKFTIQPGVDNLYKFFKEHTDVIFELTEFIIEQTKFSTFFDMIKGVLSDYSDILFELGYNLMKAYNDTEKMAEICDKFQKDNTDDFMYDFGYEMDTPQFEELSKLIHFRTQLGELLKKSFLSNRYSCELLLYLLEFKETYIILFNIIKNYEDPNYFVNYLPEIIVTFEQMKKKDSGFDFYLTSVEETLFNTLKKEITSENITYLITDNFMVKIGELLANNGLTYKIFSEDCLILLNDIYFSKLPDVTTFFLKKIIIDSTKVRNDFITYENCLHYKRDFHINKTYDYTVKPVFVVGIMDDIYNKNKYNTSILNEKFNYLYGFCLPYGIYQDNKEMCSQNDYNEIMKIILKFSFNMDTTSVDTFKILDHKFSYYQYLICLFSLLIILIPLIIRIFLLIYESVKSENIEKENKINKLIEGDIPKNKNKLFINKFKPPNWYKYLLIYFDITKNGKELFKFNVVETNFNNLDGITYIKGILGASMILYILGQVFLIMFNLPSKVIFQKSFFDAINSLTYKVIFFGLRYSPRILFSCSGFIFIYKFLCYIEQQQRFYFIKFIFLQSYKYILLIFVILFMHYSLYHIDAIINYEKKPIMEMYNNILIQSEDFKKLFSFLLFNTENNNFKNRQNLIQYFYLPINEVFLFIFGTALVSLGYKFKLRIDYIIVILILFLYLGKILISFYYIYNKDYYSTLYFYLYNYGETMLNPLFNLPSYLIGMFFGLINFSVQKGITIYKNEKIDSYKFIELFEKDEDETNENDIKNIEIDKLVDEKDKREKELVNEKKDEEDEDNNYISNSKTNKNRINQNNNEEEKGELDINSESNKKNEKNELEEKIKEMPFLIIPIKFLDFHRKTRRYFLIFITFIFICFIIFSMAFINIVISTIKSEKEKEDKITELYTLEDIIPNKALNIYYLFDIELVVFMINWIFFILYSKSKKSADIFDFFNNIHWSFFVKSYFSFSLVSTPIIIYTFYQSETVKKLDLGNILLFFFINIIFIIIGDIIFYSFYEFPFKKIFKTFFIKEEIIEIEKEGKTEEDEEEENNNIFEEDRKEETISLISLIK